MCMKEMREHKLFKPDSVAGFAGWCCGRKMCVLRF